jgi:hypothetical protein
MRRNVSGLLSQFGFGINNDLLALVICLLGLAVVLCVLAVAGML